MNRSEIEQLTDELIGEAVLSLLREKGPVTLKALIARLKVMEVSEPEGQRREAIAQVIAQISNKTMPGRRNPTREHNEWDRDNVHSLFGDKQPSGASKKH